mmetsp:Transcript_23203/g.38697  ORF Transcript_23203/g.38697 Transcript_23203/m.38697 type:complete len:706 (-) Transcript_23203:150-2267(-)
MDRLNQLTSYFNEKERRKLDGKAKLNPSGLPEMTFEEIRLSCVENNGYDTPELNEKLYLHFRGFKKIENLDKFTGCKAIWLDSNGFTELENLDPLVELRCLYLSKNLIGRIQNLQALQQLQILDVSYNRLTRIDGLSCLPSLKTLNVAHNMLTNTESIEHLTSCPELNNIDITNNRLEADEAFLELFQGIPSLVALSVNGNDVTKIPTFRKKMLTALPKLGYLDRPVEEQERRFAQAFMDGGKDAEAAEREKWKSEREEKRVAEMEAYRQWQSEQAALREEARASGRSLITEFTPEQQAQRAAEAQAAHDAEQAMLDLGIDQVAKRFYQLGGDTVCAGAGADRNNLQQEDVLEVATQQLLEERRNQLDVSSTGAGSGACDDDIKDCRVEELEETPAVPTVAADEQRGQQTQNPTTNLEDIDVQLAGDTIEEEEEEDEQEGVPVPVPTPASANPAAAAAVALPAAEDSKEPEEESKSTHDNDAALLEISEQELQQVRQERVAESFHIYKKQLEAGRKAAAGGHTSTTSLSASTSRSSSSSSTWDTPSAEDVQRQQQQMKRPLHWTESMDIHLAKLVKACVFDFDAISVTMQQLASKNALSSETVFKNPALLTNEACRLRWAQLDATQWSDVAPNSSALDTEFKVCISSAVLGAGHGAQPNFDALASMTAGTTPAYLKVPTAFPSVKDTPAGNDDGDDGVDSDMDLD